MIKKTYFLIFIYIFCSSCGYKIVNQETIRNFNITEIASTGDKRVNFLIKNKLTTKINENKDKSIKIDLETKKIKSIKEKNIKNEITKYEIKIISNVKYSVAGVDGLNSFTIAKSGNYDVSKTHSETLNSEKKITQQIALEISNEINDNLIINLNEL